MINEITREKLVFTPEEARDIIYGHKDWEEISDTISSNERWTEYHDWVGRRKLDGKFFYTSFQRGLTESQDTRPFDEN